jgi:hypothetical protein
MPIRALNISGLNDTLLLVELPIDSSRKQKGIANSLGPETPIPTWELKAAVPDPLNGGVRALDKLSNSSADLPESVINGTSSNSSNAHGTGEIQKAAPTVALFTGSANMYGAGICAVGAGMLAIASIVMSNWVN